jgi:hypothetical protein
MAKQITIKNSALKPITLLPISKHKPKASPNIAPYLSFSNIAISTTQIAQSGTLTLKNETSLKGEDSNKKNTISKAE